MRHCARDCAAVDRVRLLPNETFGSRQCCRRVLGCGVLFVAAAHRVARRAHSRHDAVCLQGGDFNLVVLFTTVLTHVPVFVGHLSLALFSLVDHHPTPVAKLAISCLYLGLMQLYFYLMTKVLQGFAPPYTHPSLLYVGQLYFYVFWYLLVGSDSPIDLVYFAMLALSNLHVVFANTGIYTDTVETLTVACWLHPTTQLASMCVGSSVAVCFRAIQPPRQHSNSATSMSLFHADGDVPNDSMKKHRRCLAYENVIDPSNANAPPLLHSSSRDATMELQQLYFLMKLAEQDHMADTSALILVPSLVTWLAWIETKETPMASLVNMWLRCIFMFGARVAGSFLSREIFAYKMQKRHSTVADSTNATVDRLRVQRIMLADCRRQFWYLAAATTVVVFACFDKPGWPSRYSFYTT
ncbi:hypothetical protein, variant [Aphanomyces invadans]|uniref:Transmembrane protein n=1 Tax=Aphanomyces invadans TaxID=157072 RepID=A0A024UAM2_9STRA|nr:hypothetical protein, variant [Aphanomyces invadans]ETW02902.1 hypothetical protein, variant [Aphanomyces invadans]|eukprot:XP_008868286.1 hypothetical protein, variant [Aphanomyces invadans]